MSTLLSLVIPKCFCYSVLYYIYIISTKKYWKFVEYKLVHHFFIAKYRNMDLKSYTDKNATKATRPSKRKSFFTRTGIIRDRENLWVADDCSKLSPVSVLFCHHDRSFRTHKTHLPTQALDNLFYPLENRK